MNKEYIHYWYSQVIGYLENLGNYVWNAGFKIFKKAFGSDVEFMLLSDSALNAGFKEFKK